MTCNTNFYSLATESIKKETEYKEVFDCLQKYTRAQGKLTQGPAFVTGLCETASMSFMAALVSDIAAKNAGIIVCPDEKTAYRYYRSLCECMDGVYLFAHREFVFHNVSAISRDAEYERLEVFREIANKNAKVIVTVPEAAFSVLPFGESSLEQTVLKIGDRIETEKLVSTLLQYGYTRADTVEGKGQFSQRGDIVDVFPVCEKNPYRMEFFGDELDAMGYFDILSQRRIENVSEIKISVAREICLTQEQRKAVLESIEENIKNASRRKNDDENAALQRLLKEKEDFENGELKNLDKYIPAMYNEPYCLADIADGFLLFASFARAKDRYKSSLWQMNESVKEMYLSADISFKSPIYMFDEEKINGCMSSRPCVIEDAFASRVDFDICGLFSFVSKQTVGFAKNFDVLCDDLADYVKNKYKIFVCAQNHISAKALFELLPEKNFDCVLLGKEKIGELSASKVYIMSFDDGCAFYPYGFELTKGKVAYLCEGASSDVQKRRGVMARSRSAAGKILSYNDLKVGDYVVHSLHGIARYEGIKTLTVDKITRDYITLQYAGSDVLYVPADQLDRVSRYTAGTENVKLSRMGAKEWTNTKARVKKEAKEMAKKLIALYAQRQRVKGYAFSPDTDWQRDFEQRFEYEETEGQLNAVNDIKRDMEKDYPMDRLLCGDVGFGKTEVALRAAFKCISDGKQAAILVPTTILALQHYKTVLSRMQNFPVRVEMLSRFCTPKQAKKTLEDLACGKIDIIVGTHKLLQKDIKFFDLGLLIVDEEQRFGVAHKERLKELATGVDVLTLTATPIPRTLNMAMAGIRDMSVLEEAPQDRYPVQTYVLEYDEFIIEEAIKKELRRGGQVFYLYNKVEGIEEKAAKLKEKFPDAEIAFAHGKMPQEQLSLIWKALVDGEVDILVCTTIIETGVDVPNANTLIIENAERYGLSQLHQIRGRIGRSSRRAYAYVTWRSDLLLTEIAQKRLEALKEFTQFGSGFKIAMRDLEIRGAGTLLGAEQSGHMEDVGYDLYIKILEEAVLEEQGRSKEIKQECTIDLRENAYLPEKFIKSPAQRIDIYKKIAAIETENDAEEILDELCDRYGDVPSEAINLIDISKLKSVCSSLKIKKVEQRENKILIFPKTVSNDVTSALVSAFNGRVLLSMGQNPCYNIKLLPNERALSLAQKAIKIYSEAQSGAEQIKN